MPWDSEFFKCRVFSIKVSSDTAPELKELKQRLQSEGADLVYVFVEEPMPRWQEELQQAGACLYDEKVTYGKQVHDQLSEFHPNVMEYKNELNEELTTLALAAGHDSRYKKDLRLYPYFETFYKLWITNSLNGTLADKVLVYQGENGIEGMVTCKIKNKTGSIGLIATKAQSMGKGIGTKLIKATDAFYQASHVTESTVVTQATNIQACMFYEKNGFKVIKTEFVYHWWLK